MKKSQLAIMAFTALAGSLITAQTSLPLAFDVSVHPAAQGTTTEARLDWRWSDSLSSAAELSYSTAGSSGELQGFGPGSLYTSSSEDGKVALLPLVWSKRLGALDLALDAGLGFKTELFKERGSYASVGTQSFDNEVRSWRVGTPLGAALGYRLGPVDAHWDLEAWPMSLYSLSQTQVSSLIAPTGTLDTLCLVGPEIDQDLRVSLLSWFWLGLHHEFLWLSVPRLAQNAAGDAWTSVIEGTTNQVLRVVGGIRLRVPAGYLEAGAGWRRTSSSKDSGGTAEIDQGLAFELKLSAGR
jgi:hypothetical protein